MWLGVLGTISTHVVIEWVKECQKVPYDPFWSFGTIICMVKGPKTFKKNINYPKRNHAIIKEFEKKNQLTKKKWVSNLGTGTWFGNEYPIRLGFALDSNPQWSMPKTSLKCVFGLLCVFDFDDVADEFFSFKFEEPKYIN